MNVCIFTDVHCVIFLPIGNPCNWLVTSVSSMYTVNELTLHVITRHMFPLIGPLYS